MKINSSKIWLARHTERFATTLPSGSFVLDAGSGDQPYKQLFRHCHYQSADLLLVTKPYAQPTYICDLCNVPVADDYFDAIVCTQVAEHLSSPVMALSEFHRILKPGGTLLCSAPLYYEEHETPHDYYRFTQFAWNHMLKEAGLELVNLEWLEGYLGTLSHQLDLASRALPRRPSSIKDGITGYLLAPVIWSARLIFRVLAELFARLDASAKYTAGGHPINYVVVCKKGTKDHFGGEWDLAHPEM